MARSVISSAATLVFCLHATANGSTSIGLENLAQTLRGDVRVIAMGDSYSAPYFARVPIAGLRVWPITNIAAICSGAASSSELFKISQVCSPVSNILDSDTMGYTIERATGNTYYTLPLRGLKEIYTSDTFDNQGNELLFEYKWNEQGAVYLSTGVHGPFAQQNDTLRFRFLYRCPNTLSEQIEEIQFADYTEDVGIARLRDGARKFWHLGENPSDGSRDAVPSHINSPSIDFPANNDVENRLRIKLKETFPLAGTNQYFEPAGGVYYHTDGSNQRKDGLYYSYIADDSWSYSGFGCDTEGSDYHDKRFSLAQFTHWLDVTTLDRNQPVVFFWYLAPEARNYDSIFSLITNMIDQTNQASKLVGLSSVQHLFVTAHMFNMINQDEKSTRNYIIQQQNAANDIALSRDDFAAVSIYEATDGVMFDGESAVPWLVENGFETFEFGTINIDLTTHSYGDLLDANNVHPKDSMSAAFFSAILGDIIREVGCPADVSVDGYIDVHDLLIVIETWGQDGIGDINNDGTTNVHDLLSTVESWGECWPVQSPFRVE